MKSMPSILHFKSVLLLIAVLVLLQACKKENTENPNCLAVIGFPPFKFKVVDKDTGEDLFFSTHPTFTTDQIYFIIGDMPANIKPHVESSATGAKHFYLGLVNSSEGGSAKAYLAGKLAYTIEYTLKNVKTSGCPQLVYDKITINGISNEQNPNNTVILLKR